MGQNHLTLQTSLGAEELRTRLKKWQPWSVRIDFSNGVSTNEFQQRKPFEHPLIGFKFVEEVIPFAQLAGGKLLDIGCNSGYNSINAATKYGFSCTGIDVVRRHIEVSTFLAEIAKANAQFQIGDAETFSRPKGFDVVLHFGTLYHLLNPYLSLQTTFENLRPGGYLGLETQVYEHPQDPNICYFMHMHNNDPTNFWALSPSVLKKCLELIGFREIVEIRKIVRPQGLAENMARIVLAARRPERGASRL